MKLDATEMLLSLAGDLSELRTRLQELENQDLGRTLSGLDVKVGELRETLVGVVAAVEQLLAEEEQEAKQDWPGTTPNWTDDLDQEQARVLWDWLTGWCQNVLWPIYAQRVWKPCWYRHPRLRIELTWLCANWHWSYEKKAPPTRVSEWHGRWWPHVEKILKEELQDCGLPREGLQRPKHPVPVPLAPTENNPSPPPPPYSIEDFVDHKFLERVEKDITRRPEPKEEGQVG